MVSHQRASLAAAVALALAGFALFVPAANACNDGPTISAYHYEIGGVSYDHLTGTNTHAGDTVTAVFTLSGCGEKQVSFVSYNTTADHNLPDQTVFDSDTGTLTAGSHSLTIQVPPCYFQIDLVYGPVIEHFNPPTVTYHAQNRFIDGLVGGSECTTTTTSTTTTSTTTTTTTEIPFFPSAAAMAIAVGGAVLGSVFMLRRRL
jgi:hypothetical protein